MRGSTALALALVGGCIPAYEPGSLLVLGDAPDERGRRLGCLDVRVQVIRDPAVPTTWPVVGVDLGNRCRRPVHVDLRHVAVTARWTDEGPVRLSAFDPRREIHAADLDGHARAREVIAYEAPEDAWGRPDEVCVDVAGITAAAPVPPVCFEEGG